MMTFTKTLALVAALQSGDGLPDWLEQAPKAFEEARDELVQRLEAVDGVVVEVQPIPTYTEEERAALLEAQKASLHSVGVRGESGDVVAETQVAEMVVQAAGENVVAVLPGTVAPEDGARRLLVAASLGTPGLRVGCLDGWTGCALLAELCAYFQAHPIQHTLVFVGCGGEALGHRGAAVYAAALTDEEVACLDAALFVQGFGSSGLHAWVAGSERGAMLTAKYVAHQTQTPVEFRHFADLGVPGGMTALLAARSVPGLFLDGVEDAHLLQLRTLEDNPALLKPKEVERTVRFVQEYVKELDGLEQPLSWEGALARYELSERDAKGLLPTMRYRLRGQHGIQELGSGAPIPNTILKAEAEVTKSPSDDRKGPSPSASKKKRADDEKLP